MNNKYNYKSISQIYREQRAIAQEIERRDNAAKTGTVIDETPIIEETYYSTDRSSNNGRLRDLPHIPDTVELFNESPFGIIFGVLFYNL